MIKSLLKTSPWIALAFAPVLIAAYIYVRHVGLEVNTSEDAFVLPAPGPPSSNFADGRVATVVELTPAPWPSEVRTIHALLSLGIPVRIVVQDDTGPIRFVVERDTEGRVAATFQNRADAAALFLVVPEQP